MGYVIIKKIDNWIYFDSQVNKPRIFEFYHYTNKKIYV